MQDKENKKKLKKITNCFKVNIFVDPSCCTRDGRQLLVEEEGGPTS